jgi:hypothetical protein
VAVWAGPGCVSSGVYAAVLLLADHACCCCACEGRQAHRCQARRQAVAMLPSCRHAAMHAAMLPCCHAAMHAAKRFQPCCPCPPPAGADSPSPWRWSHHARCTLHAAHCTLHAARAAHCTLHTAHCTLHTAHCTLHTARCTSRAICALQPQLPPRCCPAGSISPQHQAP